MLTQCKEKVNTEVDEKSKSKVVDKTTKNQPMIITPEDTYNSLRRRCLERHLKWIEKQTELPHPILITDMFINDFNKSVNDYNKMMLEKDKDVVIKERPINKIEVDELAKIVMACIPFKNIKYAYSYNDSTSKTILGFYRDKGIYKGLYCINDKEIYNVVEQFVDRKRPCFISEVIKHIEMTAEEVIINDDPDLSPVNNGIYNRRIHGLMDFSPEYVFVKKAITDYNPDAENPHITLSNGGEWDCETQLDSFSDDPEIQQLLRRILTATLFPKAKWEKAIFPFSQKGANGKSTYLNLIKSILGDGTYLTISLSELEDQFALEEIAYFNHVFCDEVTNAYIDSSVKFKIMATGNELPVNRKFRTALTLKWKGIIIQALNSFPRVNDTSEAFIRRLLFIEFNQCFLGREIPELDDILNRKDVREYYLKIALEGDTQPKHFSDKYLPKKCLEILEQFRMTNNPVNNFYKTIIESEDYFTTWNVYPLTMVYALYKKWYKETHPGQNPLKDQNFYQQLADVINNNPNSEYEVIISSKSMRIKPDDMKGVEKVIIAFELEDYINHAYRGDDPVKITDFKRPQTTRAIMRRKNPIDKTEDTHSDTTKDSDIEGDVVIEDSSSENTTKDYNRPPIKFNQ